MTIAHAHLVDASVTRWYHCVTRSVQRASCSGKGSSTVKAESSIGSRNLLKSSPWPSPGSRSWITTCTSWSGSTRMWPRGGRTRTSCAAGDTLFRPRQGGQVAPVSEDWVQRAEGREVDRDAHKRLQSLSWFMKCLKLIDALESHGHLGYLFAALRRDRPEMNWPSGLATARDTSPAA